jgi:hypothetical protein
MTERELFNYPPYCRLIQIILKHRDTQVLNRAANQLAHSLRHTFSQRVLGPDSPAISRVQNLFIKHILLKIEVAISPEQTKELVDKLAAELELSGWELETIRDLSCVYSSWANQSKSPDCRSPLAPATQQSAEDIENKLLKQFGIMK